MQTDEVLSLLKDVAEQVINPRFRALADGEIHEKRPGDLVTDADREAEVLITAALVAAYPDAVVLGEETFAGDPALMERYAAADHAFTVDPVDGTKNFVHGSKDHAVMVSETVDGEAVRAWIWQPQHEVGYVAERGSGTWRHDADGTTRLTVPERGDDALRGRTSRRAWIGQALAGLQPMTLTWVSCGIDYPKLVEGEADYILYASAAPWDHVPGSLLLAEAGGLLGTTEGVTYSPRDTAPPGLVAAGSPTAYDHVCRALASSAHLP
ncbi:inositol monophosphatase family protein [Terrabacter sp. C0L_2]|uniref:inositol monophosphatase family protein n=1 Tax=Terrabacter sp. C0L_2 TaxID=3108389 RepID=UPI002ED3F845|nr:inositol monophosphatase family protein [Terrabacter sp. C0L_2]